MFCFLLPGKDAPFSLVTRKDSSLAVVGCEAYTNNTRHFICKAETIFQATCFLRGKRPLAPLAKQGDFCWRKSITLPTPQFLGIMEKNVPMKWDIFIVNNQDVIAPLLHGMLGGFCGSFLLGILPCKNWMWPPPSNSDVFHIYRNSRT